MSKTREVTLRAWAANNSGAEVARQCGITRGAVNQAINSGRKIFLHVDDSNNIKRVTEYKSPVRIWNKYN